MLDKQICLRCIAVHGCNGAPFHRREMKDRIEDIGKWAEKLIAENGGFVCPYPALVGVNIGQACKISWESDPPEYCPYVAEHVVSCGESCDSGEP